MSGNGTTYMVQYREETHERHVSFSNVTYYYCSREFIDNLAKMEAIQYSRKIEDTLIDEMCTLLDQFHITERYHVTPFQNTGYQFSAPIADVTME